MVCRETTHPQAAARHVKPIIVEPEAEADISEAFNWYEDQREGLGKDFMLCLEAAFTAARDRPGKFSLCPQHDAPRDRPPVPLHRALSRHAGRDADHRRLPFQS